jgi:SlyX protein
MEPDYDSTRDPMQNPMHDMTQRLNELEIKASFADDLLEQLNQVVLRQQVQLDKLGRQLNELRQQMSDAGSSGTLASLREEMPPHY